MTPDKRMAGPLCRFFVILSFETSFLFYNPDSNGFYWSHHSPLFMDPHPNHQYTGLQHV